ncbi:amino acid adenylation domain-containing protein [Streptomyces sp. NPDC048623]|uniref:non-ribosomal peptide synthetase/MFS transporter n=1 Tax=Streptomyces sp. NPDC048623 TaxID=3155761 RepID=UPI00343D69C7
MTDHLPLPRTPDAVALSADRRALLAQRLRRPSPASAPAPIPRRTEPDPPLSYAQERLWFLEQYAPGTGAYTIPLVRRLHGPLDADALRRGLGAAVRRHEVLRTRFSATEDGRPVASVLAEAEPRLRVADAADDDQAQALVDAELAVPVDPAEAPLLRALLVRLGPDEHVLALAVHHLACDGWSAEQLLREVLHVASGGEPGPEPELRYGDFAAWQREGRGPGADQRDLAHWLPRLACVLALDLPLDHPRPAQHTASGAEHSFALGADVSRRVAELARTCSATPYMVLLAAFQLVLGRISGQRDFAVGTPVAGRTRPELEDVVGLFVNTLALRADLDPGRTFREQLDRVRTDTLDAFAHQELPYEQLVAALDPVRDISRTPVFQVLFALQNYGSPKGNTPEGGLRVQGFPLRSWAARFELELYITGDAEDADGFHGQLVYNTDCYLPATARRLGRALRTLLTAAVADPDTPVGLLPLLDTDGAASALAASRGEDVDFPSDATLHALVEAGLRDDPGRTAVTAPDGTLTRDRLAARANRVAHALRARGVGPGQLVAVSAERSIDLVVGLLGVLKSGAGYLPLDPEYPRERLEFMLADSGARILLTQRRLAGDAPGAAETLLLDDPAAFAGQPDTDPEPLAGPLDTAYAIYTSGSTGHPKGVLVPHRAIVNRLHWMQRAYPLTAEDAVLQKTPASFDVSVWEFFWPLLAGARLVLARPGGHKDPEYLRDVIAEQGVTFAHFVPAMLGAFTAAEDIERCRSLRRVVCSGEELAPAAAAALHARLDVEVHNLYGPTEAAVDVSAWPCPAEDCATAARLPIGLPIQNTSLYVLDDEDRLQPDGVPGQLYIAGAGLAHGYLGRPGLTAERFRPDPYGPPGSRMYATGDLALRRPDGALEFLGRLDRQVKIRGMRIEPGETEAALTALPGVRQAVVIVREDRPGDQRLVAYLTGTDLPESGDLREELRRTLPEHLVPAAFVALPELPLTPSGKLDRDALPPPAAAARSAEAAPPAPGAEQEIAAIWQEVLGLDAVGAEDDFFALGGHSLLATQVVARLRKRLDAQITVLDLFKHPTVRALARLAETPEDERGPAELLHELSRGVTGDAALTLVCVPYGGGSAVVYQPLADELPPGHRLFAVSMPGHDLGRTEAGIPFEELVSRCTQEILDKVTGPVALYGHCAIGSAVAVELARRLEAAGRVPEAVYVAGIFPFARPRSRVLRGLSTLARRDRVTGHRVYENWLRGLGLELGDLDQEQAHRIVRTMREDSENAERHFTELLDSGIEQLTAPVVSVVGDRDPATEFAEERYQEWHFLSRGTALVVLDEAGHFFLKYRAAELAEIVTRTAEALDDEGGAGGAAQAIGPGPGRTWWLAGSSRRAPGERETLPGERRPAPPPSLRRFLAVSSGQLVSLTGSALTEFAIPIWIYLHTGSLAQYALFTALGLAPGLLAAPIAGAIVDRSNRKHVMLAADCAAGGVQLLFALLTWSGQLEMPYIYAFVMVLSVALTFQRLAYGSAVPQLVPKQYLGHANGITQMIGGAAQVLAPLLAAGLMALIGLGGILALDVASYVLAVAVTAAVRFPRTLPWRPRETLMQEIRSGLRYSWQTRGLRAMLLFFAVFNIFLSPLFILLTPLTLSLGSLADAGWVSLCAGLGAVAGGLTMGLWGGPRHQRMRGILLSALALAACCAVPGLGARTWLVAGGAFAMSLALAVMNGIYFTTVQVKVAQRFHGRVFALNTVISWSTLPLGFAVVAPLGSRLLEPLMTDHGALADSVGRLIGTGPGRGIALLYILFAFAMAGVVAVALRVRALRTFDSELPDAPPDDLVGLEILRARHTPQLPTPTLTEKELHSV